jgi:hypothetical protein
VSYPGKPSCLWCTKLREAPSNRLGSGAPVTGKGAEGGRSTGSTEDSGPMKPGNSVEEKTLTTGTRSSTPMLPAKNPPLATVNTHLSASNGIQLGRPGPPVITGREAGSRGREARMTT